MAIRTILKCEITLIISNFFVMPSLARSFCDVTIAYWHNNFNMNMDVAIADDMLLLSYQFPGLVFDFDI